MNNVLTVRWELGHGMEPNGVAETPVTWRCTSCLGQTQADERDLVSLDWNAMFHLAYGQQTGIAGIDKALMFTLLAGLCLVVPYVANKYSRVKTYHETGYVVSLHTARGFAGAGILSRRCIVGLARMPCL